MSSTPEPILGLDAGFIDPSQIAQERKRAVAGKRAIGCATLGLLLAVGYGAYDLSGRPSDDIWTRVCVACICCWVVSMGLGIYSWRTRIGKIATIVSVVFDTLSFLVLASITNRHLQELGEVLKRMH